MNYDEQLDNLTNDINYLCQRTMHIRLTLITKILKFSFKQKLVQLWLPTLNGDGGLTKLDKPWLVYEKCGRRGTIDV